MKKILITGAAGFIGFYLSLVLKSKNHFVIGIDNFNSSYDKKIKFDRRDILKNNGIEVINEDINNKKFLIEILKKNDISHLIHLAARAGVRDSLKNPQEYIYSNIEGFLSVLEAIKEVKIKKFIFASSSSIYGNNKKIPFKENDITDFPTNVYGATKKADELMAYSYHHLYNIPMIGFRYFTVYGPWGRPDMSYFIFSKNILEDKEIKIFNHGKMKRDFTYIDDIIPAMINSLDLNADFEMFNLGNNSPIGLLEFVEIIEKCLNKKAIKKMLPMQKGEVEVTYADIEKSKKFLNFLPKTSIEEGIEKFIRWFKKYYFL
ncbi:MAG: hypothetical protein AMS24_03720 [Chlamydiae bacterium SM23_39]|nr:MAG: hypothetical protein AMS24_03720 [Chlamydiae bacterium SM23_39]